MTIEEMEAASRMTATLDPDEVEAVVRGELKGKAVGRIAYVLVNDLKTYRNKKESQ